MIIECECQMDAIKLEYGLHICMLYKWLNSSIVNLKGFYSISIPFCLCFCYLIYAIMIILDNAYCVWFEIWSAIKQNLFNLIILFLIFLLFVLSYLANLYTAVKQGLHEAKLNRNVEKQRFKCWRKRWIL